MENNVRIIYNETGFCCKELNGWWKPYFICKTNETLRTKTIESHTNISALETKNMTWRMT
jgi:hypothetical protein